MRKHGLVKVPEVMRVDIEPVEVAIEHKACTRLARNVFKQRFEREWIAIQAARNIERLRFEGRLGTERGRAITVTNGTDTPRTLSHPMTHRKTNLDQQCSRSSGRAPRSDCLRDPVR